MQGLVANYFHNLAVFLLSSSMMMMLAWMGGAAAAGGGGYDGGGGGDDVSSSSSSSSSMATNPAGLLLAYYSFIALAALFEIFVEGRIVTVTVWEESELSDRTYWLDTGMMGNGGGGGPTRGDFMYRLHLLWHEEDPYARPILPRPVYLNDPWPGYFLDFFTDDNVQVYPDDDNWHVRGPQIHKVYITRLPSS